MKVTLTGAAGRIGRVVCRHLLEAGHEVVAVDRQYCNDLGVRLELADVTDPLTAYRLLEGAEALIHLATPSASHITLDTFGPALSMNMNLFQAAADVGVTKIIYASSIQAVSGRRRATEADEQPSCLRYLPLDGCEPTCPGRTYGLTKVLGEQQLAHICRLHGLQGIALRLPAMIGDLSSPWFTPRRLDSLGGRQPADEAFAWLHMDDAARLANAILAADLPGFRTYTPAADEPSVDAPIEQIVTRFYPEVALKRPLSQISSLVDGSRITRDTGWTPQITASSPAGVSASSA